MISKLPARAILTLKFILGLLILALVAGHLLLPIADPDFFWHLRTGAWIWEHKSLPSEFLFTFTAPRTLDTLQRFSLTSYWGAQIVLHLAYTIGGWTGIYALRFLFLALLVWALVRRRTGDDLILLGLLLLTVIVLRLYLFERPQVLSFIFLALLLEQLDWFRRLPAEAAAVPLARRLALPLLMTVWANCHAGYIVGQGLIGLYLATEALKHLHPALDPLPWRRYRLLLAAGSGGFLAALINPNTYHGFQIAFLPSWATMFNLEYQSTIVLYRGTSNPVIPVYWFILGLAVLGTLLAAPRLDLTRLSLVAVTGWISFTQIRHVGFLVVAALPLVQEALSRDRYRTAGRPLVLLPAFLAAFVFLKADWERGKGHPLHLGINTRTFPVDAADFLETAHLQGRMYNFYTWGGYLLWRLAPAKVFIDGRNSDQDLYNKARMFDNGGARVIVNGSLYWKTVFRAYGIRYTVTPIFDELEGGLLPILDALMADGDWVPVFLGPNSMVFVERTAENQELIDRSAIPKPEIGPLLLERFELIMRTLPKYPSPMIAKGDLLVRLSRLSEAQASYEQALRLLPHSPIVRDRLNRLRGRVD